MQALRTILWVVIAVVLVVFTMFNWTLVSVRIWPGLVLDTKLPVLVLGAFLLGLLPMWLVHRASRWRLGRRIDAQEREIGIYRAASQARQQVATETAPESGIQTGTEAKPGDTLLGPGSNPYVADVTAEVGPASGTPITRP